MQIIKPIAAVLRHFGNNKDVSSLFPHLPHVSLLSGSGGHSVQMTSYSDSGYQDSSVSYYSNQNVVRSEPRASLTRSPRAEGQASGQVGLISVLQHQPFKSVSDMLSSAKLTVRDQKFEACFYPPQTPIVFKNY